ncbi:DUF7475 family protein [Haloferacaceae archaeon DSL9]
MGSNVTVTDRRVHTESLSVLHWTAIAMATISGIIHLVLGVSFISSPLGISFLLAGIGFFVGVGLILLDYRRRLVYAVGIPFTAIQIVLWYWFNYVGTGASVLSAGPIEIVDKVAQAALIALLGVLLTKN